MLTCSITMLFIFHLKNKILNVLCKYDSGLTDGHGRGNMVVRKRKENMG